MKKIRVMFWGFGSMGSGIGRVLLKKQGVDIVGVVVSRPQLNGREMHEYLGVERGDNPEVIMSSDPVKTIRRGSCDIVVVGTDSFTKKAFPKIKHCVEQGIDVICMAEEMAWPWAQEPELAREIDRLARKNGVTVFGTGINPGFVLDLLILALTGTCSDVKSVYASRVNDLSPFGTAVMVEQGVGDTPARFKERVEANELAGHVGFPESISIIAEGLGVKIKEIKQSKDPIISKVARETPYAKVEPGNVAGIHQQGFGYTENGECFVHLDHPQQIRPQLGGVDTGDYITIKTGDYDLNMCIKPETPGGVGTISMMVNMIPHVINAKPGLVNLLELPIPSAIIGDMREFLTVNKEPKRSYCKGDCVVIHINVLKAGERAANVPQDTAALPLEMWVKGSLNADAVTGDTVKVTTLIGREVEGVLTNRDPSYQHNYGHVIPELMKVHQQVKEIVMGREAS